MNKVPCLLNIGTFSSDSEPSCSDLEGSFLSSEGFPELVERIFYAGDFEVCLQRDERLFFSQVFRVCDSLSIWKRFRNKENVFNKYEMNNELNHEYFQSKLSALVNFQIPSRVDPQVRSWLQ